MNRPDVPTLESVEVLPGRVARVTVEGGQVFFLSPEETPRASMLPQTSYGPALLTDWRDSAAPSYNIPASLIDTFLQYFDPPTVQAFTLEGDTLTLTCDHMGHASQHTVTIPAPVTLSGRRSEALHGPHTLTVNPEGPNREQFTISAFAWPYLRVMLSGEKRIPVTHRRTLPTLTNVDVLPDGTARFTLDTGETTELAPVKDAALSGPNYAPYIAWLDSLDGRAFVIPDALICRAVEAIKPHRGTI